MITIIQKPCSVPVLRQLVIIAKDQLVSLFFFCVCRRICTSTQVPGGYGKKFNFTLKIEDAIH